jgi:DHA1 family multidrug resistance protein-like MFS transporter
MQGIKEIVREAPFGQLLRYMTRNRVLLYPEEQANFQIPDAYTQTSNVSSAPASIVEKVPSPTAEISTSHSCSSDISSTADAELARDHAPPWTAERLAADAEIAKHDSNHHNHHHTHAVVPAKTPDGIILADWYTTDDPANPLNWSRAKKTWTAFLICLYTFVVYAGSSIYVSSVMLVMERFQIPEFKASLGLALYVLGMF